MHAVILAGGRGIRLGAAAAGWPKPMLEIGGQPFLDHLLARLAAQGVNRATLLCGYRAETVEKHYSERRFPGMDVECIVESEPLGTGGALVAALPTLPHEFWVLNGDSFFDIDPLRLEPPSAAGNGWGAVLALARVSDVGRYGAVTLASDGRVAAFKEKGARGAGLVSGGVYRLRHEAVAPFVGARSLEHDVFPALAAAGRLWGIEMTGTFIDIGTPEDLDRARRDAARLFASKS